MTDPREPAALTIRALRTGAGFAIALFLTAVVLDALGSDIADRAAFLGIVALIATPALSLAATAFESWNRDRTTALLALGVIGVLAVAVGVALFIGR